MISKVRFESELLGATVYPKYWMIFFHSGILSQWAEVSFNYKRLNEMVNCAEQAMMLIKAHHFKDLETYEKIKKAEHPRDQKLLGRMVQGFDADEWSKVCLDYVAEINFDKFSQARTWKELLMLTYPYTLVEASPSDSIWGIGMGVDNPSLLNIDHWGQNLLGQALMIARSKLIGQYEH